MDKKSSSIQYVDIYTWWNNHQYGLSTGCRVGTCSSVVFPHAARESPLQRLEPILPSFFSDLCLCRAVSHNIFFPHSSLLCGILLFPKSVFPKALPAWLLGSAVPHGETWSRLELTRDHYVWHGAVPASVHGGPCSPLLPKPQHKHSIQHIQCY